LERADKTVSILLDGSSAANTQCTDIWRTPSRSDWSLAHGFRRYTRSRSSGMKRFRPFFRRVREIKPRTVCAAILSRSGTHRVWWLGPVQQSAHVGCFRSFAKCIVTASGCRRARRTTASTFVSACTCIVRSPEWRWATNAFHRPCVPPKDVQS
jgi:hypothetical protein